MSNKIVYMIHTGEITELEYKCIKSLRRHSEDCKIYLYTFKDELKNIDRLSEFNIDFKELDHSTWDNRRMANKIETIQKVIDDTSMSSDGDCVLVLDSDLYFQDDPFKLFERFSNGDVFITSRGYSYKWSINAGVWGFVNNEKSRRFVEFYINQIQNPSWDTLVEWRRQVGRGDSLDWWVDQDFLCIINDKGLPEELSDLVLLDIGPQYNYCPSTDIMGDETSKEMLRTAIGNTDYKILHLKASLKHIFDIGELE